jgi:hypothetical protein
MSILLCEAKKAPEVVLPAPSPEETVTGTLYVGMGNVVDLYEASRLLDGATDDEVCRCAWGALVALLAHELVK